MPKLQALNFFSNPIGPEDPLEKHIHSYLEEFIAHNSAAGVVAAGLRVVGIGLRPSIDHIAFRTLDVEKRMKEFLEYGYAYDKKLGVIEYPRDWAKAYRKNGYPTILAVQPFDGARGKGSVIPAWVKNFGEKNLHHIAIQVDDIEKAVFFLEKQNVKMGGPIHGDHGADFRKIFIEPEMKKNREYTVLELTERHRGYTGFLPL